MIYHQDKFGTLYLGDAKDILQELREDSIDLVFTDPPYLKEYLYTYQYLADYCPRIMKTGASLVTIVGHFALEKVMESFNGKLKYRWILCMSQFNKQHARMAMGIEVMWKPMLWYVKDKYPQGRGFLRDGIEIEKDDGRKKDLHKWQQSTDWAEYYIKKLTKEGDVVLDPYMGSGTVAIVCEKLNRKWVGIEIDEEYCKLALERILKERRNSE
jgi:DNA modification methylase